MQKGQEKGTDCLERGISSHFLLATQQGERGMGLLGKKHIFSLSLSCKTRRKEDGIVGEGSVTV